MPESEPERGIPEQWIEEYVENLRKQSVHLDEPRRSQTLERAKHTLDMLKVWREQQERR